MAFNFSNVVLNELIATNGTNYHNPNKSEMDKGIEPQSDLNSELINSFLYKCSAAVKNIQENGAVCYYPGKTYYPGNVVVCQVVENDYMTTNVFRCKKQCTDELPLKEIVISEDNSFIYFKDSEVNSKYWDRVFINSLSKSDVLIKEFKKTGQETSDLDLRYVELFNDNILKYQPNQKAIFRLTIKRDDSFISANIDLTIVNSKIKIEINDLYCNNYEMDSTTSIFNQASRFKDFALLGSFISIDKQNNKVYIVFCPRADSVRIDNKFIQVNLSQISGNLRCRLKDVTDTGKAFELIKIPFINHASSQFNKAFETFDSFEEIDYIERFKRGLILLDGKTNADKTVYSCLDLYNRSGNNFDDCNDRYSCTPMKQHYLLTNQTLQNKFDKLTNIEAQFKGVIFNTHPNTVYNNFYHLMNGIFSEQLNEYLKIERFIDIPASRFDDYIDYNRDMLLRNNKGVEFHASAANKKYDPELYEKFFLDSTKVYKYVFFI